MKLLGLLAIVAVFTGCSNGSSSSLVPAAVAHSATAAVGPAMKRCKQIAYAGVGWQYMSTGPDHDAGKWYEWSGTFSRGADDRLVPCLGDALVWSGEPPGGQSLAENGGWGTMTSATALYPHANAVTMPFADYVGIVKVGAKQTTLTQTIDTAPNTPVDVAIGRDGTMYVLVVPPQDGLSPTSILVYPKGRAAPAETLTDSNMGQNPGAIAVDAQGDLYVAYTQGFFVETHIDKFARNSLKPARYVQINLLRACSLAIDDAGVVVLSAYDAPDGTGRILGFDSFGLQKFEFPTTANPASLSINSVNRQLTVADTTANKVTTYSYPNGTQIAQNTLGRATQTWVPGSMVQR